MAGQAYHPRGGALKLSRKPREYERTDAAIKCEGSAAGVLCGGPDVLRDDWEHSELLD